MVDTVCTAVRPWYGPVRTELKALRPSTSDKDILKRSLEQDEVFSFLLSLDKSYDELVRKILTEEILPDVESVCGLVKHEQATMQPDKRRKITELEQVITGKSLYSAYIGDIKDGDSLTNRHEKGGADKEESERMSPLDHEGGSEAESGVQQQQKSDSGSHDQGETQGEESPRSDGDAQADRESPRSDGDAQTDRDEQAAMQNPVESLPWLYPDEGTRPREGWIRFGASWKGKATLQPVQACEASQPIICIDLTCL
ncbi:hypothetical protein IGI04_042696 [Brassica rapa subsp. trilocularis]|uniref:Uncharacterized protein n=1 Tax=Brassica rapa subsp. trilocularis TaxID=1813537 RepID=A0ABQ7KLH3_BRACM|nr:hypothetical protein IGI04_042696 [Brassica rapa subsp. trilocularis]